MIRKMVVAGAVLLTLVALSTVPPSWAALQDKPSYTPAEYNAYTACANDKNAQTRAKCFEDFLAKFPQTTLNSYAYYNLFKAHNEFKSHAKTIEWADKYVSLGDKVDIQTRLEALASRTLAFQASFTETSNGREQLVKARDAALEGVRLLEQLPKPDNVTPEQFADQKRPGLAFFHHAAGFASLQLKEFAVAVPEFQASLASNPNDGLTYFRMGVAYLQMEPAQYMNGFWSLARSVALKGPGEAQVRSYLRSQLIRYQGGTVCEKESNAQLNELLALAGSSSERPMGYTIPSAAEIDAARRSPEWLSVLRNGGGQARVTWLAMCGLEFPEVYARVFEVAPQEASINLKIYTGTTPEDMEAATGPNCEVKVNSQPLAANFQKDDYFRFAGTLANYTPDPFMLTWDNARINPEDLPADKSSAPGKRGKRPPAKRVGR